MNTTRLRLLAVTLAAVTAAVLALCTPATAAGRPLAAPGVAIYTTDAGRVKDCTLSYAASDASGGRLAVTAGHCAKHLKQEVYLKNGKSIGTVIGWQPDDMPTQRYGYTVIWLYDDVAQTAAIDASTAVDHTGIGNVGDTVCMYGVTSGRACSVIALATDNLLTTSSDIADHGDSGAPVVRVHDGALLGIVIGGNRRTATDRSRTLIEPVTRISALVQQIPDFAGFGPVVANPRPR